ATFFLPKQRCFFIGQKFQKLKADSLMQKLRLLGSNPRLPMATRNDYVFSISYQQNRTLTGLGRISPESNKAVMKEPKSSKFAVPASLIGIRARETDQRTNRPTAVDLLVRNRFSQGFLLTAAFAIVALAGITRSFAGTFNANFDDGMAPSGATINGSAYATNATGVNNTGCLHLTDAVGGQQGSL